MIISKIIRGALAKSQLYPAKFLTKLDFLMNESRTCGLSDQCFRYVNNFPAVSLKSSRSSGIPALEHWKGDSPGKLIDLLRINVTE